MGLDASVYTAATAKVAQANEQMLVGMENVVVAEEKVTRATANSASGLDKLLAKNNLAIKAQQEYQRSLDQVTRYEQEGIGSVQQRAMAISDATRVYENNILRLNAANANAAGVTARGLTTISNGLSINRIGMMELQAAGINSFQALAAGMDPFRVATMEGAQVMGAFVQGGLLTGRTLLGLAGPVGSAVALVGTLVLAFMNLGDAQKDAETVAAQFAKTQEDVNKVLMTTAEAAQAATQALHGKTVQEVTDDIKLIETQVSRLQAQKKLIASGELGINTATGQQEDQSGALAQLRGQIAAAEADADNLRETLERLNDPTQTGKFRDDAAKAAEKAQKDALKAAEDRARFVQKINNDLDAQEKRTQDSADKRNTSVEKYISSLENVADTEGLSTEQKEIQRATIEAQNKLIDDQGNKLRDLTETEKQRIANAVQLKEQIDAQTKANDKFQKDVEQTSKRVLSNVSQAAGDILFDYLSGKTSNFWQTFEDLGKRAFANILADSITQTFLKGPINSLVSSVPGLFGITVPGATGSPAAGSASGVSASSLLNFMPNPTSLRSIGSGIANAFSGSGPANALGGLGGDEGVDMGFAAGESAGSSGGMLSGLSSAFSAVPVWGWITLAATIAKQFTSGASPNTPLGVANTLLLPSLDEWMANPGRSAANVLDPTGLAISDVLGGKGSFASYLTPGGLLNNILGGSPSVGPNGVTEITGATSGRLSVGATGADNGADGSVTATLAQQTVDAINKLADAFGLNVYSPGGDVGIFQGAANAGKTMSGGDFINSLIGIGDIRSTDPHIQDAINSSDATNLEANLQSVTTLIALMKNISDTGTIDPKPLTQSEQVLKAINDQFDTFATKAADFGYSLAEIEQARQKALQQVTQGFNDSIQSQILGFTNPMQQALDALDKAQATRLDEAKAAGADLVAVEKLSGLEREKVVEQYGADINQYLKSLKLGDLSTLSPADKLKEAQGQFGAAIASQNAADATAAATNLLNAAKAFYASSSGFAATESFVTSSLTNLGHQFGLPGFADGTTSAPAGYAIVGERGPEIVRFRGGESVTPNNAITNDNSDVVSALEVVSGQLAEANLRLADQSREMQMLRHQMKVRA
jgi:hypothetical protein